MGWYRRSKFGIDAFRSFASKVNFSLNNSIQRTNHFNSLAPNALGKLTPSGILRNSCFQYGIKQNQYCNGGQFFLGGGARRYYSVHGHQIHHFRPRGPHRWCQNPRNVVIAVLVGSGLLITVSLGNLETIPYTKRTHFVLLSKDIERRLGEYLIQQMKASFRGKILPAIHPESVRVRLITTEIIEALQRGLRKEQVWTDLHYASNAVESGETSGNETLMALSDSNPKAKGNKEDEILDDSWVQQSRKKGQEKGSESATGHIEGLKWEVLVVNDPVVNAFCLLGGKIVVFTGLLEHFRTDAEIATIIAHEVGHAVARHAAEGVTKNFWFAIIQLVLHQFVKPDVVDTMSALFLRLPFSRRMEMEADYIGLLLMASAGYNPRIAPPVHEKLDKISEEFPLRDYLSTHPSGKKRAQLLAQAKVMDEALTIYREVQAGKDKKSHSAKLIPHEWPRSN